MSDCQARRAGSPVRVVSYTNGNRIGMPSRIPAAGVGERVL